LRPYKGSGLEEPPEVYDHAGYTDLVYSAIKLKKKTVVVEYIKDTVASIRKLSV
jgi:hypothetical protein